MTYLTEFSNYDIYESDSYYYPERFNILPKGLTFYHNSIASIDGKSGEIFINKDVVKSITIDLLNDLTKIALFLYKEYNNKEYSFK